jgi:hypothetical protein
MLLFLDGREANQAVAFKANELGLENFETKIQDHRSSIKETQ